MKRGDTMRYGREKAGISVDALSALSGVSARTIKLLESGRILGSVSTLMALSKALGISIDTYLDGTDKVLIEVPPAKWNEDPNLFIGINGVNYLIPKGKRVAVPPAVAAEYHRSLAAAAHHDEVKRGLMTKEE